MFLTGFNTAVLGVTSTIKERVEEEDAKRMGRGGYLRY
jgi:hypothetical protein